MARKYGGGSGRFYGKNKGAMAAAIASLAGAFTLFLVFFVFDELITEANTTLGTSAWFTSGLDLLRSAPNILGIIAIAALLLTAVLKAYTLKLYLVLN